MITKPNKKIVAHSNFDNETVSEFVVADNIPAFYAEKLIHFMQKEIASKDATYYYKLVDLDYELYIWEP